MKVDAVLEMHDWNGDMWLWAVMEIHLFVFLDNAWPSMEEQKLFTENILGETRHQPDIDELCSKVKYVL